VRVEVPAWIAHDEEKLKVIGKIVFDQAQKGRGYPVCLAEAHEQAVIKGPDREFFYHVLQKAGIEQKQHYAISQKSLKKRGIGI
jgi:NurA-like 5'-3' nuclease